MAIAAVLAVASGAALAQQPAAGTSAPSPAAPATNPPTEPPAPTPVAAQTPAGPPPVAAPTPGAPPAVAPPAGAPHAGAAPAGAPPAGAAQAGPVEPATAPSAAPPPAAPPPAGSPTAAPAPPSPYAPPAPPAPAPPSGAAGAPPTLYAPAPPPWPASPPDDPRVAEPHADRVILQPTAYTHPAGTVYFSDYDIVVLQAGYAFTDRTQLTLTTTPPLEGSLVPIDVSLKTAVYRGPLVRAAGMFSASGIGGLIGTGLVLIGRVGGVVQLCPDPACHSTLVASTNLTLVGAVIMASSLGTVVRLGRRVALLAEADTITPLGTSAGQINGAALSLGLRLFWRRFATDLAAMHAFNAEAKGQTIPLLVLTYRALP